MEPAGESENLTPTQRFDRLAATLPPWQSAHFVRMRRLLREAAPTIREEWKWNGPVWQARSVVCSFWPLRDYVKIQFFRGALLDDPDRLLNTGQTAKSMRGIDIREGDAVDEAALARLFASALAVDARLGKG